MYYITSNILLKSSYPNSVADTSGADHMVRVQPSSRGLVDEGTMARPLVAPELATFHTGPPRRATQPVHVLWGTRRRRGSH